MGSDHLELARAFYPDDLDYATVFGTTEATDAFRATFEPLLAPELETIVDPRYGMLAGPAGVDPSSGRTVRGMDGLVAAFIEWLAAWDTWVVSPTEFRELDHERVYVGIEIRARPKGQRAELTSEGANVLTFRAGKVARIELYLSRRDALEGDAP